MDRNPPKYVDLPEPEKRTRVDDPEEREALRTIKEKDSSKRACRQELWRIVHVALNVDLREGKLLAIGGSKSERMAIGLPYRHPPFLGDEIIEHPRITSD